VRLRLARIHKTCALHVRIATASAALVLGPIHRRIHPGARRRSIVQPLAWGPARDGALYFHCIPWLSPSRLPVRREVASL